MQKLARKLRKSAEDVYGDDDYSLPTRDDSRPIDIHEQEELVRSLEMIHAQQSLLWRSVFAGLVSCFIVFLVYSMFQQAYSPWDLKYHTYFMNEIDSGSIVAAELVAVLICSMIITGLMHSSKRHRLWLWYSFLPGTLLAIFWLHHMLSGAGVCLYVDGLFSESSEEVRKLRGYIHVQACFIPSNVIISDAIVHDVLKNYLVKYGKQWDGRKDHGTVGKTPHEAATSIVEDYELPITTDELLSELSPIFARNIKAQPGANRLINHLRRHGVLMGLASNSSKENIETKISYHQGWNESFCVIIGGDEVTCAKPSPEIYLEAAKRLKVDTSSCLVFEDSMPGVTAAKAAGMEVVAVPSLPKKSHLLTSADEVINSLLDFRPEKCGLPAFEDWLEGTLPIEPWYIGSPVIKGYGRGSKVLGIPTANLSTEGYSDLLSEHPSGVYFGWAGLGTRGVYKMVMSIGWNPYFNNTDKTIEPWLLHDFKEDFYGEDLRLAIVGYIRPEANFESLESLVVKIHEDGEIAEKALQLPQYSKYRDDPYLKISH